MAAQTDITPEEKLLRVIQKGGGPGPEVAASAEPPQAPEPAGQSGTVVTAGPVAAGSGLPLNVACRILALAALVLAAGSGYELVRAVPEPEHRLPVPDRSFLESSALGSLPRFEDTIDRIGSRRMTGLPPRVPIGDPLPPVMAGWRAHIRDHFRMMGISTVQEVAADGSVRHVREAIVLDSQSGGMYFLSSGKKLVIKDSHVTVKEVFPEAVVFEAGDIEMTFHKQGAAE